MNGEVKQTKEPRISTVLGSLSRLRGSVSNLTTKVDILVGSDPPKDEVATEIDPATLKDLLDHIPGWIKEIESDIEYNIGRLSENLQ